MTTCNPKHLVRDDTDLAKFWRRAAEPPATAPAEVPAGTRVYAVGDIHGRADLLARLLDSIGRDAAGAGLRKVLVFLGDYVDRGPDSAGVVDLILGGAPEGFETVTLMGNHEWMLLRFLGDIGAGPSWLLNGGWATLESYGVTPSGWDEPSPDELTRVQRDLAAALPARHLAFLRGLAYGHREGGYVFVHAGMRPGVDIDRQVDADLIWIREPFLSHDGDIGAVAVHGHTIAPEPQVRRHRIGIDTGAYMTGRLTCAVLEGRSLRFLVTPSWPE